jgi:nonsense-mediated mRNA decay protein 3
MPRSSPSRSERAAEGSVATDEPRPTGLGPEFCVVCGRTDVPLTDGVCPDCFAARTPLLWTDPQGALTICPTCGARQVGAHWERRGSSPNLLSPEDLVPFVRMHPEVGVRRIRWEETGQNPMLREMQATAALRFRGRELTAPLRLTVKIVHRTCPECSRRTGHYFTARIQLRGPSERIGSSARRLRESLHARWEAQMADAKPAWRQALSWKEELPEGWDFYLTDTTAARALARYMRERLSADLKESATLWGRKHGEEVYRVTFRLRVPNPESPSSLDGRA